MISSVIKIRQVDKKGKDTEDFVLVRSSQHKLDIALEATDGESPFVGSIEHASVQKLQAKAYKGGVEEWRKIISCVLLADVDDEITSTCPGLDVRAAIDSQLKSAQLKLSIRKNVDGITQRLGDISLDLNEAAEINLFDWTAESAVKAAKFQQQKIELQSKVEDFERTIADLRSKLRRDDEGKVQREDHLLGSFSALLHAKKIKIKAQQRLLAAHGIDQEVVKEEPMETNGRQRNKRKAGPVSHDGKETAMKSEKGADQDVEQEDDAAEESDVTQRTETPDLDSEMEDADDEQGPAAESAPAMDTSQRETKGKPPSTVKDLPPKRTLPFTSKSTSNAHGGHNGKRVEAADREGDETDDEL